MASTTGKRIKDRRRDLGISTQELADLLGKNRTTIYRYESDAVEDMPYMVLQKLAVVLQTTPAYLMGLTDDPVDHDDLDLQGSAPAKEPHLAPQSDAVVINNPDIRMIARNGDKMTPEQAEQLRKYAEFMFPEAFK